MAPNVTGVEGVVELAPNANGLEEAVAVVDEELNEKAGA